jgi:hypothetical protein
MKTINLLTCLLVFLLPKVSAKTTSPAWEDDVSISIVRGVASEPDKPLLIIREIRHSDRKDPYVAPNEQAWKGVADLKVLYSDDISRGEELHVRVAVYELAVKFRGRKYIDATYFRGLPHDFKREPDILDGIGGPINLKGQFAEDYDWDSYFASGADPSETKVMHTMKAVTVLRLRIDELCKQYRELLAKRGDLDTVKTFDVAQDNWEKSREAEIASVWASLKEGSDREVAISRYRFALNFRRLRELKELKANSTPSNQ